MDLYACTPVGPFPIAPGNTFASFTARQDVSPFPLPVIQGQVLRLGSRIIIEAIGELSTTGTVSFANGFYIGTQGGTITTVIAEDATFNYATAAAWPWMMRWTGICTALGVSGTVVGSGFILRPSTLTNHTIGMIPATQALRTFTWDTTIARAIGVCSTCGVNNAANNIKVNSLHVELVN